MPDDSTRKLLKVFGVSVTECEDAVSALAAALGDPSVPPARAAEAVEAYGRSVRALGQRWLEVGRLILEFQSRAQDALASYVKQRGPEGGGAVE